ncbi:Bug family tripartite tricarboxylate transporter substrate binding protein [Piscinibacter sakaiensis]|uniref:Putative exported protein n=1 Tax=Piscinibacter sakaiensis TaxID=1547922 RepID=A0A0K8P0K0_PISS1|nr:tripartite tricarboxylate transporter substrate binding protein [Piscinibacter sakaiensis]GAP36177.1 putative exported protein [Piscinibacter sakaiensis]
MRTTTRWLAGLALAATTLAAAADGWPTRPVRLLVAFPAGAPGDIIARLVQPQLQQALGQPVIVDNKPGAGGNLGAQEVARATDGHTFLVGPDTMVTINPHLYRKLAFKPAEDLRPVSYLARFNQLLVCHPSTGFRTLDDFLAGARKGRLSYASGGAGVPGHMAMEMLVAATGVSLTHVPYRGPGPAAQDVIGNSVPCGFLATPVVGPHVRDGRLVDLAVSGSRRTASLPQVPTIAESGIAGFDASFYETLWAPAATPPAVIARLQAEFAKALAAPETRARLAAVDLEAVATTPAEAARQAQLDSDKWGAVQRRVQLQLD